MGCVRRIEVVGPGCERCTETARVIRAVIVSAGIACEVVQSHSPGSMRAEGAPASPVVLVDGHVVISGRVPNSDEIRQIIGVG